MYVLFYVFTYSIFGRSYFSFTNLRENLQFYFGSWENFVLSKVKQTLLAAKIHPFAIFDTSSQLPKSYQNFSFAQVDTKKATMTRLNTFKKRQNQWGYQKLGQSYKIRLTLTLPFFGPSVPKLFYLKHNVEVSHIANPVVLM